MPTTTAVTFGKARPVHFGVQAGSDEAGPQALGLKVMDIAGSQSKSELQQMYDRWASLVPNPVMDYHHTFGTQAVVAPEALANHSELWATVRAHNTL